MTVDPDKISIGLGLLTQLATLIGIAVAIVIQVRNGAKRTVEAEQSKEAQADTHRLVNSQMSEFKSALAKLAEMQMASMPSAAAAAAPMLPTPAPAPVVVSASDESKAVSIELPANIGDKATIVPKKK